MDNYSIILGCLVIILSVFLIIQTEKLKKYVDIRIRTEFALQCILQAHDHLDENHAKKCFANFMDKSFKYDD